MSLPLSLLICLSVFQLCLGAQAEKRVFREEPWSERPTESEDVQKAVKFAVEKLNKKAKGKRLFKLISIKSAKSQGSSVIKYKLDAIFERTQCPKGKNRDLKSYILKKRHLLCHIVVSLDPQNSKYDLKTKKCHKVAKNGSFFFTVSR